MKVNLRHRIYVTMYKCDIFKLTMCIFSAMFYHMSKFSLYSDGGKIELSLDLHEITQSTLSLSLSLSLYISFSWY